jgi:MFS family permease
MDVTPSCKGARPRSGTSYLYIARALRGFGDGFTAIVLPAYLSALGFRSLEIGIVGTSALLGSAVATLVVGALAARYDLRTLLLLCAALMLATGLGLASFHAFGAILIVAFVGTVNPTIGDIGLHVPLEQAFLADNVSDEERTRILARYSFVGALAISAGAATAATPDALVAMGMDKMRALETMFYVYGALGVITTLAYLRLPRARAKQSSRAAYLGP